MIAYNDITQAILETKNTLNKLYFQDERAWVVAFSGGKDSTLLLQLIYEFLLELGSQANKPIFILTTDTRVEPPNIYAYLQATLEHIQQRAQQDGLPVQVKLLKPKPGESFWGKLIGQGYPSPTRWFRWCTAAMKIRPARREIEDITRQHGSVILLLGTRTDESSARSQRMKARHYNGNGLNPHEDIPDAMVSIPIANWTTEQVWEYLLKSPPPWGGNHDFLFKLYRQAAGGECPVVLDLNTPSCGGSRFGCWTCTVVKEDKSMQGFIETGDTWMQPLNAFRDHLKQVRELDDWRMDRRKNGYKGPGPFRHEKRVQLLRELLELEKKLQSNMNDPLITDEEIAYIQSEWTREFDLKQTALTLAREYGRIINAPVDMPLPDIEQQVKDALLAEYGINPDLIDKLLHLVLHEYPDMRVYGCKANLERDIGQLISASLVQDDMAESAA